MNFFVQQHIVIHQLKIESLTNSSICQIGSSGMIKPITQLFNTGGFTGPAPQTELQPERTPPEDFVPRVPLVTPS
ncbi:spore germination protein GerPB [Brevibacillus invocatus]|uniref:Spore gernimation protein n=1 Tax=Brevibacillus invocatus TaxID=173959 RepID=A0A3M8C9C1_9BACL|nr:spore germination protein GerPB [Brevibacillus invocatus]MCM3081271.1 spore germination protein GerPB [Brevibacillus invocatus]MCM3431568.1 spore germination protein GerPB [Brevibacillus invocatus]RNB72320.1 spore gernimation protein [Brevibacillus invocatus]